MVDDFTLAGLNARLNSLMFEPMIRSMEAALSTVQVTARVGQAMSDAAIGSMEATRRLLESLEKASREFQRAPLDLAGALTEFGLANARALVRAAETVQGVMAGRAPVREPVASATGTPR